MPNFAKKCKRHIRRIFYSKVFSCVCLQDHKDPTTAAPKPETTATDAASDKLEILLLKTLKNQLEDRDYHDQLKTTLQHVTKLLEQIGKNYEFHQRIAQRFPNNAGFSQLTISVSKDSLVRCQSEIGRRSLVVVKKEDSSILENGCQSKIISVQSGLFPRGHFSSIFCRAAIDKAIQIDSEPSAFLTDSKLIQTQLLDLSNFNVTTFKIDLIKHMRTLKEDVVTLRQLLFSVERYSIKDVVSTYRHSNEGRFWRQNDDFDHKFFEAKIRAANFMKFYRLRGAAGGGKKRAVKGGSKERRMLLRKKV